VTKLKYNSKAVIGAIRDLKDVFIWSYYKIGELKYILKVEIKIVTERKLVVDIKTLLDIIFIAL